MGLPAGDAADTRCSSPTRKTLTFLEGDGLDGDRSTRPIRKAKARED
jgi:hypothetical protein